MISVHQVGLLQWSCSTNTPHQNCVSLVEHPALCLPHCAPVCQLCDGALLAFPFTLPWGEERPAGPSHFRGPFMSLHFSISPPKKTHLMLINRKHKSLTFQSALFFFFLQVPLFSTLEVMCWVRLSGGSFFPLQSEMCWKAAGIVCLNLQINQATPASTTGFCLNIWYLSFPRRMKWA